MNHLKELMAEISVEVPAYHEQPKPVESTGVV